MLAKSIGNTKAIQIIIPKGSNVPDDERKADRGAIGSPEILQPIKEII